MVDVIEVPVRLGGGDPGTAIIYVEARRRVGEGEVASGGIADFGRVTDGIRLVARDIGEALKEAGPDKLTVEMGFEVKAEAGGLIALLARGGATATINVTMVWDKPPPPRKNGI